MKQKVDMILDELEEKRLEFLGYKGCPEEDNLFDKASETLLDQIEEIQYRRMTTVDSY